MQSFLQQLLNGSSLPVTTDTDYYFEPRLLGSASDPKFNARQTGGRITRSEYNMLRDTMIRAGGTYLKRAQILKKIMVAINCCSFLTFCGYLLTLFKYAMDYIAIPLAIAATLVICYLVIAFIWIRVLEKTSKNIQQALDEENSLIYRPRGLYWKIDKHLYHMSLHEDNQTVQSQFAPQAINTGTRNQTNVYFSI